MVAINTKVIYRFEVRALEESFFNVWVQRDFVNGDFCLRRRKILSKGHFIDLSNESFNPRTKTSIQRNNETANNNK